MKKLITTVLLALFALTFYGENAERTLYIKPNQTHPTETNWGENNAWSESVERYAMEKVGDNLYKCILTLNAYYKTKDWKTWHSETYSPDTPDGWSNVHTYVVVFGDNFANSPSETVIGAKSFIIEEDGAVVTFYAKIVLEEDGLLTDASKHLGKIRSVCDAQEVYTVNNPLLSEDGGTFSLPPAIGKDYTFSTSNFTTTATNTEFVLTTALGTENWPDFFNEQKVKKVKVSLKGRILIKLNYENIFYSWHKILDEINTPLIKVSGNDEFFSPESEGFTEDLGEYSLSNPLRLGGKITGTTKTAFDLSIVAAKLYYEIIESGESTGIVNSLDLATTATGTLTTAVWENDGNDIISTGLANGDYTLNIWYETECLDDVIKSTIYTTSFSIKNPHTWTGATDTTWSNFENWNQNSAPNNITDVIIPASAANFPTITEDTEVASLTMDFGAQINIESGTLEAGKISVKFPIPAKRWDAIGFPFEVDNIYCPEFAEIPGWEPTLSPYVEGSGGDFWLKECIYDGDENAFSDVTGLSEGEGYIIQFPESFGDNIYTAVFEGTPPSEGFSNASSILVEEAEYKLVANPTLGNITLTSGGDDGKYYYKYNGKGFAKVTGPLTVEAFESVISVKEPSIEGTSFVLRSVFSIDGDDDGTTTLQKMVDEANDPIVEKRYYTLQGIEINTPSDNGVYIVKRIHESGKESMQKVINAKK